MIMQIGIVLPSGWNTAESQLSCPKKERHDILFAEPEWWLGQIFFLETR